MIINSSLLGVEGTAQALAALVRLKQRGGLHVSDAQRKGKKGLELLQTVMKK